ncbi:WD40 repeat domain-containing protein [Streptomyces lydicus]|uniref:WD40 repeat domain-containing protein n=1 Tax=Streptomyces lydicus TaxID=47763 RepID=UPI00379DBA10
MKPLGKSGSPGRRPRRRTLLFGALGAGVTAVAVPLGLNLSSTPSATPGKGTRPTQDPTSTRPGHTPHTPSAGTSPTLTPDQGYSPLTSVAFSPDSKLLALGAGDGAISLWDSATLKKTVALSGPTKVGSTRLSDLAFSPDGTILAVAQDKTTTLWHVATHTKIATLTDTEIDPVGVVSLAFSPDGTILACGNHHATISLWNPVTHSRITTLVDPVGYTDSPFKSVACVAFSPNGSTLAVSMENGRVRCWDVRTREITATIVGAKKYLPSIAFNPDGKILAGATQDKAVKLWDATRRVERATLTFTDIGSRSDYVSRVVESVAFSPDGKTLAGSTGGGLIQLWDIATRKLTTTLDGHADDARSAAFSPDGTMLAATLDSRMGLWKLG